MRKILGGIIVLLITIAMIFSSFAIAVDINPIQTSTKTAMENLQIKNNLNRDDIIWDNGGITQPGSAGLSSQLDLAYPFNSQVADDFQFEDNKLITDVHWWGRILESWRRTKSS